MPIESIEHNEQAPRHNIVIADFFRHGESQYLEAKTRDGASPTEQPLDLTQRGIEETRESARPIIDAIDPNQEIVVLWSSPAWRAQGSEKIIRELLEERGITVRSDSEIRSMRSLDLKDQATIAALAEQAKTEGRDMEALYSNDPRLQERNTRFETAGEVGNRSYRVYNWLRYLAEHANLNGKKLHVIGVSHFEFLNPIAESITENTVENGGGVHKGENLRVTFDFDPVAKETAISADFRGEHIENLAMDEHRFIKLKDGAETIPGFRELAPAKLWGATLELAGTPAEFKAALMAESARTKRNHFGYFIYPADGKPRYHLSKYPRRKYGPIPTDQILKEQLENVAAASGAKSREENLPRQPRFRIVFGLEEGYGTGRFRSIEEIAKKLGAKFNLTPAEVFTVKLNNGEPFSYSEPAVMIQGYTAEIAKVYKLAEELKQERFAIDDFGTKTSRIVETPLCTTHDLE